VEPVQAIPIETFPGSGGIVQSQIQEREDGAVDFIGIDLHGVILTDVNKQCREVELSLTVKRVL
jgi:hypothetical protein